MWLNIVWKLVEDLSEIFELKSDLMVKRPTPSEGTDSPQWTESAFIPLTAISW